MSVTGSVAANRSLRGKIAGFDTIHGMSAYEVAIVNGFRGTEAEWLASLKGEKGEKGDIPKKGIDYYTPEDLAELDAKVEEAKDAASNAGALAQTASIASGQALASMDSAKEYANTAKGYLDEIEEKKDSIVQDVLDAMPYGDGVSY